jgi:Leu/Phe-tRNA-protein transferase
MQNYLWQNRQFLNFSQRKYFLWIILCSSFFFFSGSCIANPINCQNLFPSLVSEKPQSTREEDFLYFEKTFKSRFEELHGAKTLTYRGFAGTDFPTTPHFEQWATQQGYLYWGMRIYFAENFQQAAEHDRAITDFSLKGLYLISSEKLSHDLTQDQAKEFFLRNKHGMAVMNTGGSFDGHGKFHDGVMTFVSQDVLEKILDVQKMKFSKTEQGPIFAQVGWTYPRFPAYISLEKEWASSSTIKRNRADLRKLLREGYRFTVNQHFFEAMEELKKQERIGTDASSNRFLNPALVQKYTQSFHQGDLISLELLNPEGQLVAGTFFPKARGILYPESPYYQHINQAKAVFTYLGDQMLKKGLPWMYIGAVTSFTRDIKGSYGTREQFENLLSTYRKIELNLVDFEMAQE